MVLTPAVIDSPRKPHTGWQKRYVGVQTHMFSQSIGPTGYPFAAITLPWLAKTRCVLLKTSVFTRKIIRSPSKPCPGWQKPHRWCQIHMFSQSDRGDQIPSPPHTLPWHTENRWMLPKSCVFPIGSASERFPGVQRVFKNLRFLNAGGFNGPCCLL